jgi:hypothetical protein
MLGVGFESTEVPGSGNFFKSAPVEINQQKSVALLRVTFTPPEQSPDRTLVTDRIAVFVTDESGSTNVPLDTAPLLLAWRGAGVVEPDVPNAGTIVLQEFRQRNPHSGYATVKYHLPAGPGELRVRVFDSTKPESASWFETESVSIEAGRGLELVPVGIASNGGFPGGDVVVDTVEVELLGQSGQVMEKVTRLTSINWSRKE